MKKILVAVLGMSLVAGCTPTRNELLSQVDQMSKKLDQQAKEINLLCGFSVEASNLGMVKYVGDNTFSTPDGLVRVEDMDKMCQEALQEYAREVEKRAQSTDQ